MAAVRKKTRRHSDSAYNDGFLTALEMLTPEVTIAPTRSGESIPGRVAKVFERPIKVPAN